MVDYKIIEDFSKLSIDVADSAGKLIIDQLRAQKTVVSRKRVAGGGRG